jgi:hypothetical protein
VSTPSGANSYTPSVVHGAKPSHRQDRSTSLTTSPGIPAARNGARTGSPAWCRQSPRGWGPLGSFHETVRPKAFPV